MSIRDYAQSSISRAKDSPFDERSPHDSAHFAAQALLVDLTDGTGWDRCTRWRHVLRSLRLDGALGKQLDHIDVRVSN